MNRATPSAMTDPLSLFDLSGQVALVTGGSRGLGRSMVLAFAACGADVVIASRKLESCEELAAEVEKTTVARRCRSPATSASGSQLDALADAAYERFGKVDVLVNNAGMSPLYDAVVNVTEPLYDKVLDVNLKGPFRLTALVGTRMAESDGGSIISISSVAAIRPTPDVIPYSAAKAGPRSDDDRVREGVRAEGAGELHRGGPVPHRHLEGVGPRGLRRAEPS